MTASQILIALATMTRKEVSRIFRIWSQTLLPPIITTALYFMVFGTFLADRIGQIHGVSYAVFIIPGLIMLGVITNAFSNTASVTYMAKFQRNIEEVLVAPVPAWAVTLGFASGGVIRGLIIALITFVTTMFFVDLPVEHPVIAVLAILLTTLMFSFMGLVNGLFAKNFDGVSIVPTFVLTPLTYLGGVFYSADSLTGIWKTISHLNPIYHIVDLFRYGFIGQASGNIWIGFSVLVFGTIAFWVWGYWIVRSGRDLIG